MSEPDNKPKIVDLIYTEDETKALAGYFGIVESSTFPYVPTVFRKHVADKSKWPVYILRSPNGLDQTREEDHLGMILINTDTTVKGFKTNSGELRIHRVKSYLTDAKRHSLDGKIIPFTSEIGQYGDRVVSKAFMATISVPLMAELEKTAINGTILSEEELLGLDY